MVDIRASPARPRRAPVHVLQRSGQKESLALLPPSPFLPLSLSPHLCPSLFPNPHENIYEMSLQNSARREGEREREREREREGEEGRGGAESRRNLRRQS